MKKINIFTGIYILAFETASIIETAIVFFNYEFFEAGFTSFTNQAIILSPLALIFDGVSEGGFLLFLLLTPFPLFGIIFSFAAAVEMLAGKDNSLTAALTWFCVCIPINAVFYLMLERGLRCFVITTVLEIIAVVLMSLTKSAFSKTRG